MHDVARIASWTVSSQPIVGSTLREAFTILGLNERIEGMRRGVPIFLDPPAQHRVRQPGWMLVLQRESLLCRLPGNVDIQEPGVA